MIVSKRFAEYIVFVETEEFKDFGHTRRYRYKFPNNYGASVISGTWSYGVELAVLKFNTEKNFELDYSTPITDDVIGYIESEEELDEILEKIYKLE